MVGVLTPLLRFESSDGRFGVVPLVVDRYFVSFDAMITSPGSIMGTISLAEGERFFGSVLVQKGSHDRELLLNGEPVYEGDVFEVGPFRGEVLFRVGDVAAADIGFMFREATHHAARPFERGAPGRLDLKRGSGYGTWKLVIEDDEGETTTIPLTGDELDIGRKAGCAIRLAEQNVSRHHVRLLREGEVHYVEDMGSRHGTLKNGRKIEPWTRVALDEGDTLQVGGFLMGLQTPSMRELVGSDRDPGA